MNASASHRLAAHRRGRARRSSGACRDFFLHRLGPRRLNGSPSSDQVNYQNYQCEYQKQVNESTHRVTGYQAHQPKNQKNYEDCPQHGCFLLISVEPVCLAVEGHWQRLCLARRSSEQLIVSEIFVECRSIMSGRRALRVRKRGTLLILQSVWSSAFRRPRKRGTPNYPAAPQEEVGDLSGTDSDSTGSAFSIARYIGPAPRSSTSQEPRPRLFQIR